MMIEKIITLRHEIRSEDAAMIRQIVTATGYFTPAETEIAVELADERLSKGAASGYEFVIAESDDGFIGYACFGEIPCTVGSYDLYWIVVDVAHQRSGIGKRLMDEVETRVRSLDGRSIYIDTSGSDHYASTHRFYERCGYKIVANLPDFYAPGDAKLIYWRFVLTAISMEIKETCLGAGAG